MEEITQGGDRAMKTGIVLLVFLLVSPFVLAQESTQSGLPPLAPEGQGNTAPGGLFPGFGGQGQQGGITVTPPSPQIAVRWKQLDLGQTFGYNPLITGVVDFPEGWLVNVDTFNRSVTFSEDATGLVAFSAYLAIQDPSIRSAEELAQRVIAILSQNVTNLAIVSQDFRSDPQAAQNTVSITYGRVVFSGVFQGRNTRISLHPYVMYVPLAQYSLAGILLYYAPEEAFQEKLNTYFNHMVTSWEKQGR
jgi:hypothetical protein